MKEGVRPTSPVSAAEEPIVFVIDDDPLMLGGPSSLFRSIGLRVEAFASATELLQRPLPAVPSCLVLDIRLPRHRGVLHSAVTGTNKPRSATKCTFRVEAQYEPPQARGYELPPQDATRCSAFGRSLGSDDAHRSIEVTSASSSSEGWPCHAQSIHSDKSSMPLLF